MKPQNKFSSKFGFIAAAAGSAVGLSNVWKFPYEAGAHGGAVFLFLYLACTLLLSYPLTMVKFAFGRRMQGGVHHAYLHAGNKAWAQLGLLTAMCSFVYLCFYYVIMGWVMGYFVEAARGTLLSKNNFGSFFLEFTKDIPSNLLYTFLSTLATALVIKDGINKGIERWSKLLMPLFILLLVSLIGYAFTLKNAFKGISFYLIPNFSLLTPKAAFTAISQSFMSLAIGAGLLTTYGSYMNKKDNLITSSAVVVGSDTLISFLAGLLIFPLIFYKGITPSQGPSLIFVSLPPVFQSLGPTLGMVIAAMFFLLMLFAAVTSSIALLEVVTRYLIERFGLKRSTAVLLPSIAIYLGSIPCILAGGGSDFFTNFWVHKGMHYDFLSLLAFVLGDIALPMTCFLFCLFIVHRWGVQNVLSEIQESTSIGKWTARYIYTVMYYVCPILVGSILFFNLLYFCFGISITDVWQAIVG